MLLYLLRSFLDFKSLEFLGPLPFGERLFLLGGIVLGVRFLGMKEFPVYERRVQFHETDMAGIMHFSRILTWVEEAEQDVMHGIGVPAVDAKGGFPKVHVTVDYRSPLRYREVGHVRMRLLELGERSLTWGFEIWVGERLCVEGKVVTVLVSEIGRSAVIPVHWREKLGVFLVE